MRPSSFTLLILIAIGLVLTAPLLQGQTLCTDDGALHIYRTVALDRAVHDGVLFPRWFPDLAYGYGFPFFVYREPLGYYLLEGLHLLGVSAPNAFNLVLAGSVILSGIAMFLLARDIFGARGGLLAGLAYMSAPYLLIGSIVRGNLPEVIAFALMPLILFCFRRLILLRQTRYFVASILTYAALFLTHNISSLLFTPLLLAYLALLGRLEARNQVSSGNLVSISHLRYAISAVALTLALTVFFWFPAIAEQDQAQLYLTHSARGNDYHFNFIGLRELLGGPGSSDPNLLNPPRRIVFGWPQLALAALGLLAYRRARGREQRAIIVAAAIATLALAFMALPASLPLWDRLPLIRFVQFPWRFVGRAILPAALLAGAVFLPQRAQRNVNDNSAFSASSAVKSIPFGIAAFVVLLFTAPLSYPRACPTPYDLDINDVFAYERATGHIGVDPLGAYLPRTVVERPTGSPLEAQYAAGTTIERFDTTTLPDGARLLAADYGPTRADLVVSTPADFTATYLAFNFSGWQVWIDDQPVATHPTDPTGLIAFDVPSGEHRIRIAFGESPQRALADGVSLIALIAAIVSVAIFYRRSRLSPVARHEAPIADTALNASRFTFHVSLSTLLALAAFLFVKALFIDPGLTPLRATRLNGNPLAGVAHPLDLTFGDQLRLLGYETSAVTTRPGEIIRVDLYWTALRPLAAAYQAEVGIAGADGWPWSPKHAERPRDHTDYPTTPLWPPGGYVVDSFEVEVLPGTPPGDYDIVVQVFDRNTLAPLQPSAAPIGSMRIERATRSFDVQQLRIYGGERLALDPGLTLLGYNIDRVDTVPGESVLLTFFWQAERAPQTDRAFRVELANASNEMLASQDVVVGGQGYPTSRWSAGEQIISLVTLRVPAAAPSGEYHWRGALLDAAGQPAATFEMRPAFRVDAPERSFDIPTIANSLRLALGEFATLLGFDLATDRVSPGDAIELTLYWQARAETETSYKVFVHLVNAEGRVVAQADAAPVNGARPTTGWLPGEVIADRYAITLPGDLAPGEYRIVAGMYDPESNARLKTTAGDEAVALAAITVISNLQ
ncbi:MAG TPA: hypothetical protein VJG32_10710 [Anaerolineae bacterium]|nr:hypothetical protein [Anaerolineae bacterium]